MHYPRNEFLLYGWYDHQWWIGSEEEEAMLQVLYGNSCSIADRERVIGPALAPIDNEYISSNCSKEVDSGIVRLILVRPVATVWWPRRGLLNLQCLELMISKCAQSCIKYQSIIINVISGRIFDDEQYQAS